MGWGEVGELGGGRRRRGEAGEGREAGEGEGRKEKSWRDLNLRWWLGQSQHALSPDPVLCD